MYRRKEEMYRHLSLDIVRDQSIQGQTVEASVERSLAQFFQPEIREIKCEKCPTGTHAEQTLLILKRYAWNKSLDIASFVTWRPAHRFC